MINKLRSHKWLSLFLGISLMIAMILPASFARAVGPNLALGKTAVASSVEGTGFEAAKAVDGSATTRWASVEPATTAQWIYVDLGSATAIGQVILKWEAAYATSYQVQTSNDATNWTSIYTTTTGDGATDDLAVSGSGRYLRVNMTVRGTAYGYSLWELEVYGTSGATATNTVVVPTATKTNTPVAAATATNTSAPSGNLALGKTTAASSVESSAYAVANAVDGSASTRWASVEPAPNAEWIYVDLGASYSISRVFLNWEAAYATGYQIQTSSDAVNWASIYTTTTGNGATDDLTGLSGSGRYIRVNMTARGTAYGYSLYEFEVYGSGGSGATATKTNTPVPPTATRTNTPVVATATRTRTPTPTLGASPTATSPATGDGSTWMGHNWAITNGGMAGVAPGSPSNVFVDANGYLHLKITKNGSAWTAAEMFSTDRMGFGTYQWQIEGNVTNMDKSTVLGLFPYGPADGIGGDGENEIDIEFSKWDNGCGTCTADFTFYPSTGNGNLGPSVEDNFHISQPSNFVTARIVWTSTSIVATIYDGLVPVGSTGTVLQTITYTPSSGAAQRIPQVPLPLGMNFWSFQSNSASNQEVILRNFQYVP